MTSKQFLGSLAVVAGLAVLGTGCGSKNSTGSGGTTSSTVSGSTTSKTSSGTSKTTVTSSTSSGGGDGHDINSAVMINVNDPATSGTFVDATMTHDFYTFTGKSGERIVIVVSATGAQTGANPAATDPAFGLIGSGKDPTKPLSYQVGGWPNFGQSSTLFVQLPADGAYYLDLSDCNAFFMNGCPNPASGVTDLGYSLIVADTSMLTVPEALASTANATEATAAAITYMPDSHQPGAYLDAFMGGAFSAPGEEQPGLLPQAAGNADARLDRARRVLRPTDRHRWSGRRPLRRDRQSLGDRLRRTGKQICTADLTRTTTRRTRRPTRHSSSRRRTRSARPTSST